MTKNQYAKAKININDLTQVGYSAYVDHLLMTPEDFQGGFHAATAAIVVHLNEEGHLKSPSTSVTTLR